MTTNYINNRPLFDEIFEEIDMRTFESLTNNKKWKKRLKKDLSSARVEHTLRVAKTAYTLALAHECNEEYAVTAAMLHDCAKNYKDSKLIKLAKKYKIPMSEAEKDNTDLLHSKVGAYVARDHYKANDSDVFNAIAYHTTGRPSMSELEKILYISDYIEPGRKHKGRLDLIREIAPKDLDLAVLYILEDTLEYLGQKSKTKDPKTKEAYRYYKALRKD